MLLGSFYTKYEPANVNLWYISYRFVMKFYAMASYSKIYLNWFRPYI